MDRETEIALIDCLRAMIEHRKPQMASDEARIPASVYFSPERFEAERRLIFRRHPIVIAHSSALSNPGDFLTHDALGVPLVVLRDREGVLRAFLNVCRHRGSRLVLEDCGTGRKAMVCGYHGWTYGLDGRIMHIPHPEGFPRTDCDRNLVPVGVSGHGGFIWVLPTPEMPLNMGVYLGELATEIDEFDLGQHTVYRTEHVRRRFNWKLIVDAFLDGYHIRQLHRNSVYRFFHDNLALSDDFPPHIRSVVPRKGLEAIGTIPEEHWNFREVLSLTYFLFPNTILIFHPDWVSRVTLFPVSHNETIFTHTMLLPAGADTEEQRPHWEKTWSLIHGTVFEREDIAAAESIQSGIESGANDTMSIGRYEHTIATFHRTVEDVLANS